MRFIRTLHGYCVNSDHVTTLFCEEDGGICYLKMDIGENVSYIISKHNSEEKAHNAMYDLVSRLENGE